jgi:hypothetical protein
MVEMNLEESVLLFRKRRKVSFDGKSHLFRFPKKIVRLYEEDGIQIKEPLVECFEQPDKKTSRIVLTFGEYEMQKEKGKIVRKTKKSEKKEEKSSEENESHDENDYVVLGA